MSVLVIGRNGRALMPTTSRKARILLKKETASVVCRHPFTIQLLYKTGCATQEGCIGIDTGSQHIGVGVTCGDRMILKDEHELHSFICSFTGTSVYLVDKNGCYISQPGKTYKQWPLSKLKRLHPNGNWLRA